MQGEEQRSKAVGRSEECRKRITDELTKLGDERITRESERWFEHLTEEENKRKKRREEEDDTRGARIEGQRAASSSGVTASPEIARSRG